MMKTLLSAACATALLAGGAAFAQSQTPSTAGQSGASSTAPSASERMNDSAGSASGSRATDSRSMTAPRTPSTAGQSGASSTARGASERTEGATSGAGTSTIQGPQSSTVKDPARMEKPGWSTSQGGSKTQPYPSASGQPSAFDKAEQKAMQRRSGDRSGRASATAGGSTQATFPECSDAGAPEEVTRCLNRNMAQALERGVGASEVINR